MKIGIIGNGISAWCINKYLLESDKSLEIDRFGSDEFIRACSLRTTSINCMRGTKKGISPLGDLMVDSLHEWDNFYKKFSPRGVTCAFEYQLWNSGDDRLESRFDSYEELNSIEDIKLTTLMRSYKSDAHLINPLRLYESMNLDPIKGKFVSSLRREGMHFKLTSDGDEFIYDKVYLCASNYNSLFLDLFENEDAIDFVNRTKPVKGEYLYIKAAHNINPKSIALKNRHLIFRSNEILIGSTSYNDDAIELIRSQNLKAIYNEINGQIDFNLPHYDEFTEISGLRSKGRKRIPYWGEVAPGLYMVGGLYKNAFSFAFKAASDLSQL